MDLSICLESKEKIKWKELVIAKTLIMIVFQMTLTYAPNIPVKKPLTAAPDSDGDGVKLHRQMPWHQGTKSIWRMSLILTVMEWPDHLGSCPKCSQFTVQPRTNDKDGDGVNDSEDRCPDLARPTLTIMAVHMLMTVVVFW